ncbi:MAG: CHASE2 and HATPase_c domain-containing protein [Lautropia sp.]|nr:CHASE2 and HATPase_c domain-containing protein [Lautropia sp.]
MFSALRRLLPRPSSTATPGWRPLTEWLMITVALLLLTLYFGPWMQHASLSDRLPDPTNRRGVATPIDYLNLRLYDLALESDHHPPSGNIVLVDIDDISMLQIGRWPWPRPVIAALVNRIAEARPEALGIDILFAEVSPLPHDDHVLRSSLQQAANHGTRVILAVGKEEGTNNYLPLYPLDLISSGNTLGHVTFYPGVDGLVRGLYLEEGHLPALALALIEPTARPRRADTLNMLLERRWDVRAPLLLGHLSSLPEKISAAALLRGDISPKRLIGKKVLLGSTAIGSGDFFVSPLVGEPHRISGLELHAATAEALLANNLKRPLLPCIQGTIDVLLLLVIMLLLYRTSPMRGLLIVGALNVLLLLVSWVAFKSGWWFAPGSVLASSFVAYPLWNWRRLSAASAGLLVQARSLELFGGVFGQRNTVPSPREPIAAQLARVQDATVQLGRLNRFLADSLQSLPHPVLVADHQFQILLSNQRFMDAFGGPRQTGTDLKHCFDSIFGESALTFQDDPSRLAGEHQDCQNRHWRMDVSATGSNQEERRWLIQFVDLTARRQADREREETLSFLSHDLRSPQATIQAIIEQLRHSDNQAERDAGLDELARHSRRALELTDGFLAYTRAEAKRIQAADYDLNMLISEVIDLAWFGASTKHIKLHHHGTDEPAWVEGDGDLLRRALSNLVENAIRHSPEHGHIHLSVVEDRAHYRLCVRDQGPGIPPEQQTLVFKPFWQAKANKGQTGKKQAGGSAGLGLAMVQKTIERHHGSIRVFNHDEGGACFEITLPKLDHDI